MIALAISTVSRGKAFVRQPGTVRNIALSHNLLEFDLLVFDILSELENTSIDVLGTLAKRLVSFWQRICRRRCPQRRRLAWSVFYPFLLAVGALVLLRVQQC